METLIQNLWVDEKPVYHNSAGTNTLFVGDSVKKQMSQTAHFKSRQNAMNSWLSLIVWIRLNTNLLPNLPHWLKDHLKYHPILEAENRKMYLQLF